MTSPALARSVRRGYPDPEAFLAEYLRPDRDPAACTPTLGASLARLGSFREITERLAALPARAVCVIEGCSAPGNSTALAGFLQSAGVAAPRILAFDLIDVPGIWRRHGVAHPPFNFRIADAADLRGSFATGCCDLFVQDHLLNCAPHALHLPILREAARILKPGGMGLIHVTDDAAMAGLSRVSAAQLESRYRVQLDPLAYGLADLGVRNGAHLAMKEAAQGCYFTRHGGREAVLITAPHGHYESYRPARDWPKLMEQSGLRVIERKTRPGIDSNGHYCRRHYLLVGHA